ncbi:MAG: MTH1187 family thiamine-binding protein [Desulfohalobiaceae bacterium]|nr:MTH1187 family thiamine-binding protein [Desulfohalobiaceae bacterium]
MSVVAEMSIFPLDKGVSLSPFVARAIAVIKDSGLEYQLTPMGTCIEGQWPEVLQTVNRCFQDLQQDCDRISLNLKVDYRSGDEKRMQAKTASVQAKL